MIYLFYYRCRIDKTHIGQLRDSGGRADQSRRRKNGVVVDLDDEKLGVRVQSRRTVHGGDDRRPKSEFDHQPRR